MTRTKSNSSLHKAKRAQLSCNTCRLRKVKCDRHLPCSSCAQYQDPEGCRYDMSDEKRQPILMADANKSLRIENSELKARNIESTFEVEDLKARNKEMSALTMELRNRLAAYEPVIPQNTPAPSTYSSYDSNMQAPRAESVPGCSDHYHGAIHNRGPSLQHKNDTSKFTHPYSNGPKVQPREQNFINGQHELVKLSQAADLIISSCQNTKHLDNTLLSDSARDLLALLAKLPQSFQFVNTWTESAQKWRSCELQAVLLFQSIHGWVITFLSRLGNRDPANASSKLTKSIRVAEPVRTQLINSCLTILAMTEYYIVESKEDIFSDGDICHQACTAASVLGRLEPPAYLPPYYPRIEHTIGLLRQIEVRKTESFAGVVADTLAKLLPKSGHVSKRKRVKLEPVSGYAYSGLSMSITGRVPNTQERGSRLRPNVQNPGMHFKPIKTEIIEVQEPSDTQGIDFRPAQNSSSWYAFQSKKPNMGHPYPLFGAISSFGLHNGRINGMNRPSTVSTDGGKSPMSAAMPSYMSSTGSEGNFMDSSYPPSVTTPTSSLHSPAGSLPVSPTQAQGQLIGFERDLQAFDCMVRTCGAGTLMWDQTYV